MGTAITTAIEAAIGAKIGVAIYDAIHNGAADDSNVIPFPPKNKEEAEVPPKVGENIPVVPGSCMAWKAQVLSRRDNAEMLFNISGNYNAVAIINQDIQAYNASCAHLTGKVDLLFPVCD